MAKIFTGKTDVFGGITVNSLKAVEIDLKDNGASVEIVKEWLECSLSHWRDKKVNGIWFEVSLKHANWVPLLAEEGFVYHHAEGDQVVLVKWLPKDKPNTLPLYPFTTIGVGGVVVNNKNEVLLMKEKRGTYLGWKFPGGLADPDETIPQAVAREVFEETGVKAEFQSIIMFRHTKKHSLYRNCGDIFILCYMKPVNEDDIKIVPCERETAAAKWMSRDKLSTIPKPEFHEFQQIILDSLDKHLASGKKGCYREEFVFNTRNYKRQGDLYKFDL